MTDNDSTAAASDPVATNSTTTPEKPKRSTGLIVTIIVLVLIIIVGAIAAALGVFSPGEEPEAEPTATPEETVEPEPEAEPTFAGWANPQTWCTAVRHTPADDYPESPSFIWWATVLSTVEGELAAEGTEFELQVPGAAIEPVEATVGEFGVLEVVVPIDAYGIYEIFGMFETGDGPIVPPPFVGVEVTEAEFGPECEGPEEPALDDLILETEALG